MIISDGENVSPADIESVLSLHPAVAEVAVVGMPDERWGQRVTAFVKRAPNADVAVEPAALDAWCRASSLADYKRRRDYVFVAEIPKSPVGKILRRLLVAGEYRREREDRSRPPVAGVPRFSTASALRSIPRGSAPM